MSDRYASLISTRPGKALAKRLGLPQPVELRRYSPGDPLLPGPVLVVDGSDPGGDAEGPLTDTVAATLLGWGLDVHRRHTAGEKLGAVVVLLTEVADVADLTAPARQLTGMLRDLLPGGRVVTVSRPAEPSQRPEQAAARQAVDGFLRSLAKELRGGATGNGIVLADGVGPDAPTAQALLRFLLSAKSAFVDGQLLRVDSTAGALPEDWDRPLEGQVALVTGAARGIGEAIARTLARDGAEVVVVDVPAAGEGLAAVANAVRGTALQLDVTAEDAADRIAQHVKARHGRLDVLVHNAGIMRDKLLANMTPDRWDPVLEVNLRAPVRITEQLRSSGVLAPDARVVAMSSTSGIAGNRGQTNYAATKAGLIAAIRSTAPLLATTGGTANAVAPGIIETDMTARMPTMTREIARRLNSLQQGGQPHGPPPRHRPP